MRGKKGKDRTSRGYCGWHETWEGKRVYLRSMIEYIVARLLDVNHISYITESHVYHIDGSTYKPDFFIFKKDILYRIIEIKYTENEKIDYIEKYKDFFNTLGISYFVLTKGLSNKIVKKYKGIGNDVKEWCKKSATIRHDMNGNKNPHYGIEHSNATKEKIGEKTKERFQDTSFRNKHHIAMKKWMTDERKEHLSKIKIGKPTRLIDKVSIKTKCLFCGNDVDGIEWYKDGVLMKQIVKNFCSSSCKCKNTMKKMVDKKREEQIRLMNIYFQKNGKYANRKEFNFLCKIEGVRCDIRSTFGTHTNFIKYMEEING